MRAAVLSQQHQPLDLVDVEPPERLHFGQVRVRVHYSGVCGSQIGEIDGVKGSDRFLPHLLGHEGGGVVVEVGDGVSKVSRGDRVVLHWMRGSGHEGPTPDYASGSRVINAGHVTTFNEEAVVAENRVTAVPDEFPLELAALLGCAVTTGAGVVVNDARLRLGESIVVLGVGGVGLSIVQAAALSSAHPIVAVDLAEPKLDLARSLGATHALDGNDTGLPDSIHRIVGDGGADVVIDTTGIPAMIESGYELTSARGRTVLVGVPQLGANASLHTLPLHFGKVLTGSHGGGTRPDYDIPRYVGLYLAGKLDLESLITDRFDLDGINDAIDALRNGEVAGRALIEVAPEA